MNTYFDFRKHELSSLSSESAMTRWPCSQVSWSRDNVARCAVHLRTAATAAGVHSASPGAGLSRGVLVSLTNSGKIQSNWSARVKKWTVCNDVFEMDCIIFKYPTPTIIWYRVKSYVCILILRVTSHIYLKLTKNQYWAKPKIQTLYIFKPLNQIAMLTYDNCQFARLWEYKKI